MAEPAVLDAYFSFDPSAPDLYFDDLAFDDLDFDFDFSVDDLLRPPDAHASSSADQSPASTSHDSNDTSASAATGPEVKSVTGSKRKKSIDTRSDGEEDEKRRARLMRNRESAQLSRQRKKHYVEELEEKVRAMHSTINDLNSRISLVVAENAALRHQLAAATNAAPPPPPPPPLAPMHYPWAPFSGYAFRPNGTHVPLVPIPRMKPQRPTPAPKANKSGSKKADSKTKKVASISLLGLLFITLVCGVNFRYGGDGNSFTGRSRGQVLSLSGRDINGLNSTDEIGLCNEKLGFLNGGFDLVTDKRCRMGGSNSSETLPALLYVPRNGKHVKINGNLIIHSVLASEKAMAHASSGAPSGEVTQSLEKHTAETGLQVRSNVGSALAVPSIMRDAERHSNVKRDSGESTLGDSYRSNPAEGQLQQWFLEGLAGPVLSSGMCTEVFRFDISSAASSSGIVPATSIINSTTANFTSDELPHPVKMKNRRILYNQLVPVTGSTLNDTDHIGEPSSTGHQFHGNKSSSAMVVSVLADPRDTGDGDGDGMMSSAKSLSRIFVVVLLDSVKYVTYSCILPLKSSSPHLVN